MRFWNAPLLFKAPLLLYPTSPFSFLPSLHGARYSINYLTNDHSRKPSLGRRYSTMFDHLKHPIINSSRYPPNSVHSPKSPSSHRYPYPSPFLLPVVTKRAKFFRLDEQAIKQEKLQSKEISIKDRKNENIIDVLKIDRVLLINGKEKQEMDTKDALEFCRQHNKDLFLVDYEAKLPVAKVMEPDQQIAVSKIRQLPGGFKEKIKEFRISDGISDYDLLRKVDLAKLALSKRHRVKLVFMFKSRKEQNSSFAVAVLRNCLKRIGDLVGPVTWNPPNKKNEHLVLITPNLTEVKKMEAEGKKVGSSLKDWKNATNKSDDIEDDIEDDEEEKEEKEEKEEEKPIPQKKAIPKEKSKK